jgi:DNA-binding transcriptional MerR regulator
VTVADAHLSIGEVLGLLQEEFPDVTISKIRFLESQGLIDPERTPSGYRKFYASDIDRLRWILVQQRENFLPLKVIKDRLESADGVPTDDLVEAPAPTGPADEHVAETQSEAAADEPTAADEPAPEPRPTTVRASMVAGEAPEPIWMADVAASRTARTEGPDPSMSTSTRGTLRPSDPDTSLTAAELCEAAGISAEALRDLERFGLVAGVAYGNDTVYDGDAVAIATTCASFIGHGIGARHLRMFKVSAEREAGFLEQVAMPLLKQRNPEARRHAVELVEELADLGHDLRAALLRANLRHHLDRA